MFVHIMEYKASQPSLDPEAATELPEETGGDKLTRAVLSHIPDPKFGKATKAKEGADPPAIINVPSSMWKHKVVKEGLDLQDWNTVRQNLLTEFGQWRKVRNILKMLTTAQAFGM